MVRSLINFWTPVGLLAIFSLSVFTAPSFADQSVPGLSASNAYLSLSPPDLYEQPELESLEFQRLTRKRQNDLLVESFKKKKYSPLWGAFNRASYVNLLAPTIGVALAAAYTKFQLSTRWGINPNFMNGVGMAATAGELSLLFWWIGAVGDLTWSRAEDPLINLELEYIRMKRFMPTSLQKGIEEQLNSSRKDPSRVDKVKRFVSTALKLPVITKDPMFDVEKLNSIFKGYPDNVIQEVKSFVLQQYLMHNPVREPVLGGPPARRGKRLAGYLYGPPGTGKTRIAELIATGLGLPFAKLSLEGATLEDLLGRDINSESPTPGKIVTALTQAKFKGKGNTRSAKNIVLLVDEADRVINPQPDSETSELLPWALKLLDPESKSFYSPYFDAEIDMSHVIIILAGNYPIADEALQKRLFKMDFPGFTMEEKREIVWNITLPKFLDDMSQNRELTLSKDDLTQEDIDSINSLIELDLDPGFRTLETVLLDFGTYLANKKYFNPNATQPTHLRQKIVASNAALKRKQMLYERAMNEENAYRLAEEKGDEKKEEQLEHKAQTEIPEPIKVDKKEEDQPLAPPVLPSELERESETIQATDETTLDEERDELTADLYEDVTSPCSLVDEG